ncbi:hypothetical protein BDK51DRAFT_25863, partial [Blyttiomyces helicus]
MFNQEGLLPGRGAAASAPLPTSLQRQLTADSQKDNATAPDELYIQKLRATLVDLTATRTAAQSANDQPILDQTRAKITLIQQQLVKLDHQLSADVVANCLTVWLDALAAVLGRALSSGPGIKLSTVQTGFPRHEPFHKDFCSLLRLVPENYLDSVLRSLLLLFPLDIPNIPKSPYGAEFFFQKVTLPIKAEVIEGANLILVDCLLDLVMEVTQRLTPGWATLDTLRLLLRHAFFYLRISATKKFTPTEGKIFQQTILKWAIVLGDVAAIECGEVIRKIDDILDPLKRASSEEIVLVLSASRYVSEMPTDARGAAEIIHIILTLTAVFDRSKKDSVRIAVIQALERLCQSLDLTGSNEHAPDWVTALLRE